MISTSAYAFLTPIGGGGGAVSSVTATSPIVSSGGVNPNISLSKATASVSGYLSSSDFTIFNNKANSTLNNLGSTSINADLFFADSLRQIGSLIHPPAKAFIKTISLPDGTGLEATISAPAILVQSTNYVFPPNYPDNDGDALTSTVSGALIWEDQSSVLMGGQGVNAPIPPSANMLFGGFGITGIGSSENVYQTVITKTGMLSKFYLTVDGSQINDSLTIYLRINGSDSGMLIDVPGGSTSGIFSNTTDVVDVNEGDLMSVRFRNRTGDSSISPLTWSINLKAL